MSEGLKVWYVTLGGYKSKAYIDKPESGGIWTGEDSFTGDIVHVEWFSDEWCEVQL